jgi:hypothetical protein
VFHRSALYSDLGVARQTFHTAIQAMPTPEKLLFFKPIGLVKLLIFSAIIIRILELEYVYDEEVPVGTASAFLLFFVGVFIVADAVNI